MASHLDSIGDAIISLPRELVFGGINSDTVFANCLVNQKAQNDRRSMMGLLRIFSDIIEIPVRAAVDVVKFPINLMNGDDLLNNTSKGIKKLEEDLNA